MFCTIIGCGSTLVSVLVLVLFLIGSCLVLVWFVNSVLFIVRCRGAKSNKKATSGSGEHFSFLYAIAFVCRGFVFGCGSVAAIA